MDAIFIENEAMYQLAVETLVSLAAGLNDLPGAEATATANSDIAENEPLALMLPWLVAIDLIFEMPVLWMPSEKAACGGDLPL